MIPKLPQKSWSWFLRNLALPAGDIVFDQGMMKRYRFLQSAQWWDRERLRDYRNKLLRSVIDVSYREVPYYRDLMDGAGVRPADIRTADDLRKIPITTKQMLRPAYPHRTTRNTGKKTYQVSSSGSTGSNFYVKEDMPTAGWYRASFLLALNWAGWKIGEPHLMTGINIGRSAERNLKDLLMRCHYVSAFHMTAEKLDATLDLLDRHSIEHIWGYPGSLFFLARRAIQRGWNRPVKTVVTWGDNLYQHYREVMEQAFGSRVTDCYGCCEGMQIAAQCGHGNHYHLHDLDVIVEFVDDAGEPTAPGETSHLIITRLHAGPMPLIRYRIGDLGISGGSAVCPCGRGSELLQSLQGRDADVVVTPSGARLVVHCFTGVLEHFQAIACYQVVQPEYGAVVVRLVLAYGHGPQDEISRRVVKALHSIGMHDMKIDVEIVDDIPVAPSGKRRFVISHVERNHSQALVNQENRA
jgi:phenylacetate-CoA ligase